MNQSKVYYVLRSKKGLWKKRLVTICKLIGLLAICAICIYMDITFILSVFIIFGCFLLLRLIPTPLSESIEVYFDRFIYKSNVKQVELDFEDIAFIDQDVVEETRNTYYKSVEFLNESMQSLLYIDGEGFLYDDLVLLCNRIYEINKILSQNSSQVSGLASVEYSTQEIDWRT